MLGGSQRRTVECPRVVIIFASLLDCIVQRFLPWVLDRSFTKCLERRLAFNDCVRILALVVRVDKVERHVRLLG